MLFKESTSMPVLMRSFKGKSILSFVRSGNHAHAGEEEAIIRVFHGIEKNPARQILDVGSGRGGTAKFIQDHSWGVVTGIDIEPESVEFASKIYPDIRFYCSDVVDIDKILLEKFDLICMFNAFYEFSDQEAALRALRKVSHDKTTLIIFDYIDLSAGNSSLIVRNDRTRTTSPIELSNFNEISLKTGWFKETCEDLCEEYKIWYQTLLEKIEKNKDRIIENFGKDGYRSAQKRYSDLLRAVNEGEISGGIIKSRSIPLEPTPELGSKL